MFNSDLIDATFEKISSHENWTLRYDNDLIKYSNSDSVYCIVNFFTGQSWLQAYSAYKVKLLLVHAEGADTVELSHKRP